MPALARAPYFLILIEICIMIQPAMTIEPDEETFEKYLRHSDDPPPPRTTERVMMKSDLKPLEVDRLRLEGQFSDVTTERGGFFSTPIQVPVAGCDSTLPGVAWTSPNGPILMMSELGTDTGPLRWVMFITGNNHLSLGVLPHNRCQRGAMLHEGDGQWKPLVGLVNFPNAPCRSLKRTVFNNVWMEMSVDSDEAIFCVHHEDRSDRFEFDIPPTYDRPLRLAICTWNLTEVTFVEVEHGGLVKAAK